MRGSQQPSELKAQLHGPLPFLPQSVLLQRGDRRATDKGSTISGVTEQLDAIAGCSFSHLKWRGGTARYELTTPPKESSHWKERAGKTAQVRTGAAHDCSCHAQLMLTAWSHSHTAEDKHAQGPVHLASRRSLGLRPQSTSLAGPLWPQPLTGRTLSVTNDDPLQVEALAQD